MKLALALTFATTVAGFANGYNFLKAPGSSESEKESTGLTVNEENRIYGGKEVDIDNYPYAVNLRIDILDEQFCGGALIASQWVLTAGHCIKTDEFDILAVLGSEERTGTGGEQIEVVEGFRHPGYVKKKHLYDIGLLKLKRPSKVKPVKMITEDGTQNKVGTVATIVGWGLTETGSQSEELMGVNVQIITNSECNKRYDNRITEGMMCAGKGDGKDSCNGDSGGPLVANKTLVGIASWGRKCGARPGVYVRLPYVMAYIKDIMSGGDGSKFANETSTSSQEIDLPTSTSGSTESSSQDASSAIDSSLGSFNLDLSSESASGSFNLDLGSDLGSDSMSSALNDDSSSVTIVIGSMSASDSAATSSSESLSSSESASTDASASSDLDFGSDSESASESESASGTYSVHQSTQQQSIDDVTQSSTPASKTTLSPLLKTGTFKKKHASSELDSESYPILP